MNREAGKGSKQRPTDLKAYADNYDAIFRKKPTEQEVDAVVEKLTWQPEDDVAYCPGPKPGQMPMTYPFFDYEYGEVASATIHTPLHLLSMQPNMCAIREGEQLWRRFVESMNSKTLNKLIEADLLVVTRSFESRDGVRFEPR